MDWGLFKPLLNRIWSVFLSFEFLEWILFPDFPPNILISHSAIFPWSSFASLLPICVDSCGPRSPPRPFAPFRVLECFSAPRVRLKYTQLAYQSITPFILLGLTFSVVYFVTIWFKISEISDSLNFEQHSKMINFCHYLIFLLYSIRFSPSYHYTPLGWGWMNWGNCGTVEFISSWDSAVGNRGELKENDLRHTQSDNPSYSDQ